MLRIWNWALVMSVPFLMGQDRVFWLEELNRAEDLMTKGAFQQAADQLDDTCRSANNSSWVALCWHDRGLLHQLQARHAYAQSSYKMAMKFWERVQSVDQRLPATTLHNLGEVYREMGLWAEARESFARALSMRTAAYGEDHALTASTLSQLGMIDLVSGQIERAEYPLRRATKFTRNS